MWNHPLTLKSTITIRNIQYQKYPFGKCHISVLCALRLLMLGEHTPVLSFLSLSKAELFVDEGMLQSYHCSPIHTYPLIAINYNFVTNVQQNHILNRFTINPLIQHRLHKVKGRRHAVRPTQAYGMPILLYCVRHTLQSNNSVALRFIQLQSISKDASLYAQYKQSMSIWTQFRHTTHVLKYVQVWIWNCMYGGSLRRSRVD